LVGRFNWALSEAIFNKLQNRSAYSSHQPVARVLALSPDLDLGYTRSWTELAHILYGLVQAADGPTSAAVASDEGQPHRVMAAMHLTWDSRCTEDLGAIFMPELFHWLTTNASTGAQLVATDTNTAMLLAESAAEARPWYARSAQATRQP
ncbi:hypothetical protein HaLaN_26004, partial [Haematococcus lacustris]